MARRGRPTKYVLTVLPEEHAELLRLSRQRTNRALGFRSKIILKSASGMSNSDVAGHLKTTAFTVGYWRKRFVQAGVDGLVDEPR